MRAKSAALRSPARCKLTSCSISSLQPMPCDTFALEEEDAIISAKEGGGAGLSVAARASAQRLRAALDSKRRVHLSLEQVLRVQEVLCCPETTCAGMAHSDQHGVGRAARRRRALVQRVGKGKTPGVGSGRGHTCMSIVCLQTLTWLDVASGVTLM